MPRYNQANFTVPRTTANYLDHAVQDAICHHRKARVYSILNYRHLSKAVPPQRILPVPFVQNALVVHTARLSFRQANPFKPRMGCFTARRTIENCLLQSVAVAAKHHHKEKASFSWRPPRLERAAKKFLQMPSARHVSRALTVAKLLDQVNHINLRMDCTIAPMTLRNFSHPDAMNALNLLLENFSKSWARRGI